jgi:Ca2+-binding RTX toxin-like protein
MCNYDRDVILNSWHGGFAPEGWGASSVHFQKAETYYFYMAEGFTSGSAGTSLVAPLLGDIPNDSSTTATVTVDGLNKIGTLETPGDQDWWKVELQAGVTYEIGLFGTRFGPTGVPLFDPLVEIRAADGTLLQMDDSGGPPSPYHTDDALLIFTPKTSGTYYINARAWDARDPIGLTSRDPNPATTTGDFIGDYEIFVTTSGLEPAYYDVDYETKDDPATERDERGMPTLDSSPLHSIDWGTRFDGTSRNPDGAEGPRPTGNEVESKIGGKNVIYYYYAREGEVFVDNGADPLNLTTTIVGKGLKEWEKKSVERAFAEYEKVADVVYVETVDRYAADIVIVTYNGTPGIMTPSLAGRMSPPDTASEGQTEYNAGDYRWTPEGLAPGGVFFGTLIHELGHGHGMAHPHDNGGRSSIMRGVEEVEPLVYTMGDFNLNQGVFTMMSYNDGWTASPYGQPRNDQHHGFIGSLMAFDIAVIQDKYGVNEEWATGNDSYRLPDENVTAQFDENWNITREATSFKSIWDAGGTDEIVYGGARDTVIDLRPATLKYEEGGGGRISHAWGIHGGFTIANAVTIENARSGSGADTLIGNDAANRLDGGAGTDTIQGGAGDDTIIGGLGRDLMSGGVGADTYVYASLADSAVGQHRDVITDFNPAEDKINLDALGAKSFIGSKWFTGEAGQVNYFAGSGVTVVRIDADGDRSVDMEIELSGLMDLTGSNFGSLAHERLVGTSGDDVLQGLEGNDVLIGLAGNDVLDGGAGNDTADYSGTTHNIRLDLDLATAQDTGLTGFDTLISVENLIGGGGANTFYGSAESNRLEGRGGNDLLDGRGGDDFIVGGAGSDQLAGRAGSDTFILEAVSDSLAGSSRDRITDFTSGADRIDLSLIDAVSGSGGNDAFTFIGSDAFSGVAGQLRYFSSSSGTIVAGDVNGDGIADFEIQLTNKAIPVETDFVL